MRERHVPQMKNVKSLSCFALRGKTLSLALNKLAKTASQELTLLFMMLSADQQAMNVQQAPLW